jgi:hypothetical protein
MLSCRRGRVKQIRSIVACFALSGSGKTLLARAAAGDAGAVLLVINGPDIMSEFVGRWYKGRDFGWAGGQVSCRVIPGHLLAIVQHLHTTQVQMGLCYRYSICHLMCSYQAQFGPDLCGR